MKISEILSEGLKYGRDILPNPKKERWQPIGKPKKIKISDLDLNPHGLSIAQSKYVFEPDYKHQNTKPITVTYVDDIPHVIDGYHRVVQAYKNGEQEILAQTVI